MSEGHCLIGLTMLVLKAKGELILSILNEVSVSAHLLLMLALAFILFLREGVFKDS